MNQKLYLLKIRLLYIEPEIWRRFVVPASINLDLLHHVIQTLMGWSNSHLYEFTIGKDRYTKSPESKRDGLECSKYRLVNLISQQGQTFSYQYDFGDDWVHELTLEESRYSNPELQSKIVCLDGARACPPEDVGGVPGYYELCEALKDPAHAEYQHFMDWLGGNYDSEKYDVDGVNRWLKDY